MYLTRSGVVNMVSEQSLRPTFALLVFLACVSPWGWALVAAQASQAAAAREGYAELPGVRIWYKDTGGSRNGQQPGLGLPDPRVHWGRLPLYRLRPPGLGPDGNRPDRPATRHG